MTSNIRSLSTEVIHLIAAGEVIDSLAAVVRELVENALDAQATRITVSIWPAHWRIRVVDNGQGMDLTDLQQAALPHSTSKIQASDDLWQVKSLGFRGEALHSIAQLADLDICSRPNDRPEGWHIVYHSTGEPAQTNTVAIAPGTIVTVSHLFSQWAARRQGLPSVAQQMRSIQAIIQDLALCHPHVTWQVQQNDRDWFSIWASPSAHHILPQLVRDLQPHDLQEGRVDVQTEPEIEAALTAEAHPIERSPIATEATIVTFRSDPSAKLYLLIGLPDRCHRRRPDWVKVAVNGRVVNCPELEQVILGAFRRTLPRDRHPICFLHLHVPPAQVDWNRHPAKAEIYLHRMEVWRQAVGAAIPDTLQQSPANLPDATYATQVGHVIKTAEATGWYANRPASDSDPASATSYTPLKAVAQVHNMYILAEHPTGVWLVEQHIAHERVLYEQLCDRWHLVPLEPPIMLDRLSEAQLEQLQRLGIQVEPFGDHLWAVRTAPESLAQRQDCAAALSELSLGGDLETALVATACRTAIRNGTPLSLPEMQSLLDQWQQTRRPRTCPHGRPICLSLEESSLSRFFRRHWVIGKSHGI